VAALRASRKYLVEDGLGCCDHETRVDCSLATYSGVELVVPKNSMLPVLSGSKGLGMPDARGQCQAVGVDHGELS